MKTTDYNQIEKYLAGTATPEEFSAFERRLRVDPELRLELLKEAGFETQLRILLQSAAVSHSENVDHNNVSNEDAQSAQQSRKVIYWRPVWLWVPVAAAAASFVAALIVPLFQSRQEAAQIAGSRQAGAGQKPVVSAQAPVAGKAAVAANVASQELQTTAVAMQLQNSTKGDYFASSGVMVARQSQAVETRPVASAQEGAVESRQAGMQDVAVHHVTTLIGNGFNPAASIASAQPAAAGNPAHVAVPVPVVAAPTAVKPAAIQAAVYAQVLSANGRVLLAHAADNGRGRHEADSGEALQPGDTLDSGANSSLTLRYADGSLVRLYSNTHLVLNQTERNRSLFLSAGATDLRVQAQSEGNGFTVCTSYLEARVSGTEFRVMTDSNGSWVGVKSGRAQVVRSRANGEVVQLEPGFFASAAKGWPPTSTQDPNWCNKCRTFTGSARYP